MATMRVPSGDHWASVKFCRSVIRVVVPVARFFVKSWARLPVMRLLENSSVPAGTAPPTVTVTSSVSLAPFVSCT